MRIIVFFTVIISSFLRIDNYLHDFAKIKHILQTTEFPKRKIVLFFREAEIGAGKIELFFSRSNLTFSKEQNRNATIIQRKQIPLTGEKIYFPSFRQSVFHCGKR